MEGPGDTELNQDRERRSLKSCPVPFIKDTHREPDTGALAELLGDRDCKRQGSHFLKL